MRCRAFILVGFAQKTTKTSLAMHLLKSLDEKEKNLIDNELVQCAKVLDPRFCDEIDSLQLKKVERKLLDIWRQIKTFQIDNN